MTYYDVTGNYPLNMNKMELKILSLILETANMTCFNDDLIQNTISTLKDKVTSLECEMNGHE
jgi:hypothetical protein